MSLFNKFSNNTRLFRESSFYIKRHISSRAFIFKKQFDGFPKESDFELVKQKFPDLKDGDFLAEAEYLSVDPYMRAYAQRVKTGTIFMGSQVAKVIESKNPNFPEGTYVVGQYGWRTHTVSNGKGSINGIPSTWIIPDIGNLSPSLALGVLGMPGNTAYFGFLELCQPKAGETVIITGAAGAVGSHVGQIARIKGCRTVGVAGCDEKGKWLVEELGFDHFINYKNDNIRSKIRDFGPYNCYFDNVGGEISSTIMLYMSLYGRISVCGAISGYNDTTVPTASIVQNPLIFNQLKMEGFVVQRWVDRWFEGIEQNKRWIEEGKLKYRETVTNGFENMYVAFADMLRGGNIGKAIVKV